MTAYDINGNAIGYDGDSPLIVAAKKLGVHLMPNSFGELNMVRRARQFTDVKWTPSTNRYRGGIVEYNDPNYSVTYRVDDTFLADTEYTGVPYSRGDARASYGMPLYGYERGFVGFDVPLEAFVTAATNPHTYFSTSSYHVTGTTAAYTPYGVTCDTLVCYAMGLSQWYGSATGFQTLLDNGVITLLFAASNIASNISSVHLGDILWSKSVHVAIITDVVIDENNNIFIEVSEATTTGLTTPDVIGGQYGGLSRRELWDIDTFLDRFGTYNVYRYASVESVTYVQSPFVTLEGEDKMHNLRNRLPLMPYMGHGFKYKAGKIPNSSIVLGTSSYAYMVVFKDGAQFGIFTVNSATSISVGFSAAGEYEAFLFNSSDGTLANMTGRTVTTKWSVISS